MTDSRWLDTSLAFSRWTKAALVDYLVAHGTVYPNRAGLNRWSKQDLVSSATDHALRHPMPSMAEAMNREPDPATDNGYGPRAVND